MIDVAKKYVGVDDKGRIADTDLRPRITEHMMDEPRLPADACARDADEAKAQRALAATSIMKNAGTRSPRSATS